MRIPLALVVLVVVLLAVPAAPASSQATKLSGTVGPSYTITLKKNGKRVTSLKAGKYRLVISDKASIHNFTLEQQKGGHFERTLSPTSFTGTKTVDVQLKKGKWKYYCSVHESLMHGFFTVK
jgi:hypothetical protein